MNSSLWKPWLLAFAVVLALYGPPVGLTAELRILTYNIHHGRGADDQVDLERIAKVINSTRPDVVALNEVDKGVNRSGNIDQSAELGRLTGMDSVFEKNIDYDGGEYGNAVLSRLPISRHENFPLPSLYEGEQRGVLVVELKLPDETDFCFAATHLDYRPSDAERMKSAAFIDNLMQRRFAGAPMIVAGDFNALPDSRVLERFRQSWSIVATALTYPAADPTKQIDYVLFKPKGKWDVRESRVVDESVASDHRPVLVVFDQDPSP